MYFWHSYLMRARLLMIGLISLSVTLLPSTSFAIRSGGVCKKVGTIKKSAEKTFTCVKKGKKLLWQIDSKESKTDPIQVLANPFATPFPDNFSRSQMVESVMENFNRFRETNASPKTFKLVVDPENQDNLLEIRVFASKIYEILPFPSDYQRTILVITSNRDFGEREISSFGFDRSDSNKAAGGPCLNCAGEGWAVSSDALAAVTPHEVFHVWQKSAYKRKGNNNPDPNNPLNPPIWFDEGSADFFGYLMYHSRTRSYLTPGSVTTFQELKPLKSYNTRDLSPSLPYLYGRLASEYIVASVGMERFLQVFSNFGNGLDFPTSFERAIGISLEHFYEKFDRNIKKMFD